MKEFIETRIRAHVADILLVRDEVLAGYPVEPSDAFDAVSRAIWEMGDTDDIAAAAFNGGAIDALFNIATAYNIELSDEVKSLREWTEVIQIS